MGLPIPPFFGQLPQSDGIARDCILSFREFERLKFSSLEEGGVIDPESLPAGYTRREEAAPDQGL